MTEYEKQRVAVLLAQFNACRAEIQARSASQAALLNLNIAAIGVITGYYFSSDADPIILLVIAVLSPMLGIIWADHAISIGNIGRFIQHRLMPMLGHAVQCDLPDYEVTIRAFEAQAGPRMILLIAPMLLLFAGLPIAAIALSYAVTVAHGRLFWSASGLGAALIAIFGGYAVAILFGWIWRTEHTSPAEKAPTSTGTKQIDTVNPGGGGQPGA